MAETWENKGTVKTTIADDDEFGINDSEDAGQTISHCHIHLIPRRKGDVTNPRGGIRNLIEGKGDWKK